MQSNKYFLKPETNKKKKIEKGRWRENPGWRGRDRNICYFAATWKATSVERSGSCEWFPQKCENDSLPNVWKYLWIFEKICDWEGDKKPKKKKLICFF